MDLEQQEVRTADVQNAVQPTTDDLNLAMLSHLLSIFFGFIAPLLIWLLNKDKADKAFVNEQAKESLNFQITVLLAGIVCYVLMFVLIGVLLLPILLVCNFIFCIRAAIKAKNGQSYRYPCTLRLLS